jgi:hypothetical protein
MLKQLRLYLKGVEHLKGLPYVFKCVKHVKGIMAEDENDMEYVVKLLYLLTYRKEFARLIRFQEIVYGLFAKRTIVIYERSWLNGICNIEDVANSRPAYGV